MNSPRCTGKRDASTGTEPEVEESPLYKVQGRGQGFIQRQIRASGKNPPAMSQSVGYIDGEEL